MGRVWGPHGACRGAGHPAGLPDWTREKRADRSGGAGTRSGISAEPAQTAGADIVAHAEHAPGLAGCALGRRAEWGSPLDLGG